MAELVHPASNGSDPAEPEWVEGEVRAEESAQLEAAGTAASVKRHLPARVTHSARAIEYSPAALPAPVVAATGGFLAGIATFVLVRVLRGRHGSRSLARRRVGRGRDLEVASTRSFLVDVHLLKR